MWLTETVDLLKLYVNPDMWEDESIYMEITTVLDKLSSTSVELSERERFIIRELTAGLLDAITLTLSRTTEADDKETLIETVEDMLKFIQFLGGESEGMLKN